MLDRLGAAHVALLEQVSTRLPAIQEALESARAFDALTELSGQARARLVHFTDAIAHRLKGRPASLQAGIAAVLGAVPAVVSQPLLSAENKGTPGVVPLLLAAGLVGLGALSQSALALVGAAALAIVSWRSSQDDGWTLTSRHLDFAGRVVPLADITALSHSWRRLVVTLRSGEQLMIRRDAEELFGALSLLRTPLFNELSPVARAGLWVEAFDNVAGLNACLLWFEEGVLLVPTQQRERIAAAVVPAAGLAPASLVHAALTHLEQRQVEGLAAQLGELGLRWIPNAELTITGSTLHTGGLTLSLPAGIDQLWR